MFTVTFYSFKGGVGRTMALMNVAMDLIKKGNTVTVLDFDLEAPGLQSFKELSQSDKKGIQDYVLEYYNSKTGNIPNIKNFLYKSNHKEVNKHLGKLWFMPASKSGEYDEIMWEDLYKNRDGYLLLEEMKLQIKKHNNSDYLLIDSRTGFTDHSSICTRQLPDLLVAIFFPNKQNIDGLSQVIKLTKETDEHMPVLYVASRIPIGDDESGSLKNKLNYAKETLYYTRDNVFNDEFTLSHNSKTELLDQMILVNHDTEGSIRLKTEYQKLAKGIELFNENSESGSKLFLDYLLYSGNEFYDDDHDDHIYSEMFGDINISEEQLSRLNKIAELFWNNLKINEMSARVCSRFSSLSFKCRRFWHYQLNMRMLLKDNKQINEDDQIKLISTFADLSNEGIPLVQLLYDQDNSSEDDIFNKKTNIFEQSFGDKVETSLLYSINSQLKGKFSLNEILISSAKYILSKKGFSRVRLNVFNSNKILSNAFFVLFMLDRQNLSNNLHKDIYSLFSSNNILKSFHFRYNTGSRTNYFNQSIADENHYPFELIDILEKMHPNQNEIKMFSSILSSGEKSIKDKLKKTVLMLNTKSPLFLFEKGLVLFFINNNTINVRSLSSLTKFIESFNDNLSVSIEYFDDYSLRANFTFKALIIEKLFQISGNVNNATENMLNFGVYDKNFIEISNNSNEDDDDIKSIDTGNDGLFSYYEYLNKCMKAIETLTGSENTLIDPFSSSSLSINDFKSKFNRVNSIKNLDDFVDIFNS